MVGDMPGGSRSLVVGAGAAVLLLGALWAWRRGRGRRGREAAVHVGHIGAVYLYPVKSTRGVEVDEVQCTNTGPRDPKSGVEDRHYVLASQNHDIVTLVTHPKMALIVPSFHGNDLVLDAPGMETLRVPRTPEGPEHEIKVFSDFIPGADCGKEVGEWLSTFLETPGLRLFYSAPHMRKRKLNERYDKNRVFLKDAKETDQVAFNNLSPYMLLCEASIRDFNARINTPVSVRNFRPNFAISGNIPFDDDTWRELYIGDAEFSFIRRCGRCPRTLVDPETGAKRDDKEPLKTLRTYRVVEPLLGENPCCGTDWVLERPGTVRLGDPVYAVRK